MKQGSDSRATRISAKHIFFYSLPMLGAAALNFLTGTYLMKYATDVLFIGAGSVGTIFLISRFWDAVNDPVCGYLSDHTHSKFGRRKIWILASALPSAIFFYSMWISSGEFKALWLLIALLLFYTALTAFFIPHYSMGAELSADYHDRNRIYGTRAFWENIGNFAGVAVLQIVIGQKEDSPDFIFQKAGTVMAITGLVFVVLILIMFFLTPAAKDQTRMKEGVWKTFSEPFQNVKARYILSVGFFSQLGGALILTSALYYTQYILMEPGKEAVVVGCFMAAATFSIPLWIWLAKKFDKILLWIGANLFAAFFLFLTFYLGPGDLPLLASLAALAGVAAGAILMINPAALADTVKKGSGKEGSYFALYTFINKSSMGLSAALIGFLLNWGNYTPNLPQGPDAALAIRLLFSLLPPFSFAVAAGLLVSYRKRLLQKQV